MLMKYNLTTSIYKLEDIKKLKEAGINSVILGTPFFSVRSSNHFSNDELKEAINLCHELDLNAYVLLNRFFVENELEKLKKHLLFLKELNVDGIYFTDMSVFYEANKLDMANLLIYNPDTILTNSKDIRAYLDLGIKACTISKEITLDDMIKIGNKVHGNLEVIVHGRLNMMHSKRTLLTNYMKFLNKEIDLTNNYNLYLMEENREEHMPIFEDEHGTHIFTGFTLCSFEEILDLYNANIFNFRIESLFSNIDDLCKTVSDYKEVLEKKKDGRAMYKLYYEKFKPQNITKGFMYKKTGLLK